MVKQLLITGASGFIGQALADHFQQLGYNILKTTRYPSSNLIYWNPLQNEIEPLEKKLQGNDLEGVIHLAGESIAAWRWTRHKKEQVLRSRVQGTELLVNAILKLKKYPKFFFSASAIGYYGNQGNTIITESSPQGKGFLAEVCGLWESRAKRLEEKGVRVVYGRFGQVLDSSGGILKRLLPFFRWCLAAQIGDGKQWVSWISREDLVRAIEWMLFVHPLQGAVNCTTPCPVTQYEWTTLLAKKIHRPTFLKIPYALIRLIFGQIGEELFLTSCRVKPQKLLESGFQFKTSFLSDLTI